MHPIAVGIVAFAIIGGSFLWFGVFLLIVAVGDANFKREQEVRRFGEIMQKAAKLR